MTEQQIDALDAFDDAWAELEEQDACDSIGGMEYRRVRREWLAGDDLGDVRAFIRARANLAPIERQG